MTLTKTQGFAALAVVAAAAIGFLYQVRANARLESEVARLKARAAQPAPGGTGPAAGAEGTGVSAGTRAAAATAAGARPTVSQSVPLAKGLTPSDTLGNRGRATAHDTFATQIWAARVGDVGLEASTLMLSAASREKLQALEARLPADYQAEYPTPEMLMAFGLAGSPHPVGGIEVLGESADGPNEVTLQTQWQHVDDTVVHQSDVQFQNTDDGWKMVVPDSLANRVVGYLSRHPPAPAGPANLGGPGSAGIPAARSVGILPSK